MEITVARQPLIVRRTDPLPSELESLAVDFGIRLRQLERQVLRHESLAMALRYAHLTKPDIGAKFRRASPLDNLRAGR